MLNKGVKEILSGGRADLRSFYDGVITILFHPPIFITTLIILKLDQNLAFRVMKKDALFNEELDDEPRESLGRDSKGEENESSKSGSSAKLPESRTSANGNGISSPPSIKSSLKDANRVKSLKFAVAFDGSDPLSETKSVKSEESSSLTPPSMSKKASLTIRLEDEVRIVASIHDAAKRLTSGSIYSIIVDISKSGTLDIGVKDLNENVLAVSLLKRENDKPGAGEAAGIRLGDVIFGVNFIPTREGSKTLISILRIESEKKKKFIHIQAWRCHQLCSDEIPGYQFPRANDMFVHSYSLYRTKVFNEWERWNFVEILLR